MTRFARAKGSKASNERQEEDATPWNVMRQQLADQLNSDQRQASVNNVGNFMESKHFFNKEGFSNQEAVWYDFNITNKKQQSQLNKNDILKNAMKRKTHNSTNICLDKKIVANAKAPVINMDKKTKKKVNMLKLKKSSMKCENASHKSLIIDAGGNNKLTDQLGESKVSDIMQSEYINSALPLNLFSNYELKSSRKTNSGEPSQFQSKKSISLHKKTRCQQMSNKQHIPTICNNNTNIIDGFATQSTSIEGKNPKLKKKLMKMNNSNILNINNNISGTHANEKLVQYEGFMIRKDDAERLKNLRKKLKSNNIEKEKINVIMRLERRKAEKYLAREKRNACFRCRKFGHLFKDCPEINGSEISNGICFKCGSMEHTYYQCKVMTSGVFRHAICFVCKEQGHIARQCSLNPHGQYPKGGCCHICGEVTHLKKDCPKATNVKPDNTLVLVKNNFNDNSYISDTPFKLNKLHENKNKIVQF